MSFALKLGSVVNVEEVENNNPLLASTEIDTPLAIEASLPKSVVAGTKSTNLQNLKTVNSSIVSITPTTSSAVKPIIVTNPMNKNAKEVQKNSSQTNTTPVLSTRVVSQKVSCNYPMQPTLVNTSSPVKQPPPSTGSSLSNPPIQVQAPVYSQNLGQPVKVQVTSDVSITKQTPATINPQITGQLKLQPVNFPSVVNSPIQTVVSTTISSVQRLQVKSQNISQNMNQNMSQNVIQHQNLNPNINQQNANQQNLNKPKIISNVNQAPVQRNTVSRIQAAPKSQALSQNAHISQVMNNANMQRVQQMSPNIQKGQALNAQKVQQTFNNQKPFTQGLNNVNHPNHKTQVANQPHQIMHKGVPTKMPVQRQSQTVNNTLKSVAVTGIQKQLPGQQGQPLQQIQKQQPQTQQQRPVVGSLQKSQTLASVNSSRVQTIPAVSKSNSVPNIAKMQQNSNVLTIAKSGVPQPQGNVQTSHLQQQLLHPNLHQQQQQQLHQQQQIHQQQIHHQQQMHQQQMHQQQIQQQQLQHQQGQQQVQNQHLQQQQMMMQKQQIPHQVQKNQSIPNVQQKGATITPVPNNQKPPGNLNSKMQQQQQHQQMVLRMGTPKNQTQNLQGNTKPSQKITNTVKASNQQNPMQPFHRNANAQVKMVQQPQNVICLPNTQKQPGCIKTIPAQKPSQRNNAPKGSIKTSLNTNMNPLKNQSPAPNVTQKTCIKTLLPQQTGGPSMMVQKSQPAKVQQQPMQQKQVLVMNQFPQQGRQQAGQVKTLMPVNAGEPRRDVEMKIHSDSAVSMEEDLQKRSSSPNRRMPLPYECLQFVLQDHNYGAPPPRTPPPQSPPHQKQQPVNGASSSTVVTQNTFIYGQALPSTNVEDDAASAISSDGGREAEPEGEETETAPEGEGDDEDSITRCICDFEHDDGYMICCDRCLVWQHVDCMGIDRSNIPDEYLCEICRPRRVDRQRARALQMRKREELLNSDTPSDSSSTTSADTDVGVAPNPKKKPLPQQQGPRRKSDPPKVRRLNNNNNNSLKRQRREALPRQPSAVRNKKETVKRVPGKRKTKRRISIEDKEEEAQDSWGSNMAPLRQWIERYEEAVTNHYSPELRARISSIKINGTHNDLKQSNINLVANGKCRLNVHSNNLKFLVATMYLPPNTPVLELRGKYMLSTQHRPAHSQGRQHVQRPGPFVFFYRLPRDGTEVCVDTRTYGNDARFVRRSCKPNAEVKHCIEKGTLHLYIVTTTAIEKNAEITIRHEQHDLLLSPNSNSQLMPLVCACNNPKECQINAVPTVTKKSTNGAIAENTESGREKRRRGRRNTVCEESDSISVISSTSVTQPPLPAPAPAPAPAPPPPPTPPPAPTPAPPKRIASTSSSNSNVGATTRQAAKEESMQIQQPQTSSAIVSTIPPSTTTASTATEKEKKDKKKMTREERKMEAIMKAFERMEKAQQRKQEVQARNAQRKESGGTHSDNDDSAPVSLPKQIKPNNEKPLKRKRRKGRARTTSSSNSQGNRRSRLNSADSDLSSGDESNSIQSPPLTSQNCLNREMLYSNRMHTPTKDGNEGTAAGVLLSLANSNIPGPSSPPLMNLHQPTPIKSPTCDSGASSSSQSSTPSTPLSSACLLVAAAVGPLAPGFKFPKTKKVLMNEWLKESPDPVPSHVPQVSPNMTNLPSTALSVPISSSDKTSDFLSPTDPSSEFLTQSYAAKSLATLVQAANSVSGICDSPPQRRQSVTSLSQQNSCPVSSGSAKKRWLRQAISEECDSPNSRPESPPSEMVAPPKKRRFARESLSSDNYTPPTTPTLLMPEALPAGRPICHEEDFVDRINSPTVEESRIPQYYDSDPSKDFLTSQHVESYEAESKHKIENVMSPMPPLKTELEAKLKFELVSFAKAELTTVKRDSCLESSEDFVKPEKAENELNCKSEIEPMETSGYKTESFEMKSEVQDLKKEEDLMLVVSRHANLSMTENLSRLENLFRSENLSRSENESSPLNLSRSENVDKADLEIANENDQDTEMEEISSPLAVMECETILKQRTAGMTLEFSGSLNQKLFKDSKCENERMDDKSDGDSDFDEFDVEAQMKKITGDDGDDYKEKMNTCSERDKSMDGLEGLMDSSKEDSDSDDKEMESNVEESIEERAFKELEMKCDTSSFHDEIKELVKSPENPEPPSEESLMESNSSNIEVEPPKVFLSIPPLSERIRKKLDPGPPPKSQLDIEAAIIESSLEMDGELVNNEEGKSILSTALRELLEAKIEDETEEMVENEASPRQLSSPILNINQEKPEDDDQKMEELKDELKEELKKEIKEDFKEELKEVNVDLIEEINVDLKDEFKEELKEEEKIESPLIANSTTKNSQDISDETPPMKVAPPPKDVIRLKDPRTCVPKDASTPKMETPIKRKLSISEYRKRKQQSTGTPPEPESANDPSSDKGTARGRSDSASSGTSSLSSDDEGPKASLDTPSLSTLPLFTNPEDEKKGAEEGKIGWSAAPTLVERQRENLTERLKREFGLFLSDDEEERARKQGLNAEAILKARKEQPPPPPPNQPYPTATTILATYPLQQLPPQPYIPPPGSASIHYSQFQTKPSSIQYQNLAPPQTIGLTPVHSVETNQLSTTQLQQFLIPQAPPGSNPYPPQYVPQIITPASTPNFTLGVPTPVPAPVPMPVPITMAVPMPVPMPVPPVFNTPPPTQKSFFNQPAPRS